MVTFGDYSLFGGVDENGSIVKVTDVEAVNNSIMIWFGSVFSERVRNYNYGGIIVPLVTKRFSQDEINVLIYQLKQKAKNDFNELFVFTTLDIYIEERTLVIEYVAYVPFLAESVNNDIRLNLQG